MNLNWKRPLFYLLIPIWLFYVFCGFPPPLPPWRATRAAQEQSEQWRADRDAVPTARTDPDPPAMTRLFFVTGTDTEIGKTTTTAALTHWAAEHGLRAAGLKPVAAGQERVDGRWVNEDVLALHAAQRAGLTLEQVGPIQLKTPCAPHLAARVEGTAIRREAVLAAVRAPLAQLDLAFVEGVGGWRVPLDEEAGWDSADFARELAAPVILVVGLRLGCINHALLTAEAIAARGLTLAGWVGNTVDAGMLQHADNLATLKALLPAPFLGAVPRLQHPTPSAVAAHLDAELLKKVLLTP